MKIVVSDKIAKPASKYAPGVVHALRGERLVVSGQLGVRPDGAAESGLEAQMRRAWLNVFGVMEAGGFGKRHLLRATIYVTVPGAVALYRKIRDELLDGHLCANTYIEVSGLAAPEFLVEIEAEAVKE